jgi:hypothetical protein
MVYTRDSNIAVRHGNEKSTTSATLNARATIHKPAPLPRTINMKPVMTDVMEGFTSDITAHNLVDALTRQIVTLSKHAE